jgi:hypothetical protein
MLKAVSLLRASLLHAVRVSEAPWAVPATTKKRAVPWFDPAVRFFVYTPDTLEPTQKHGRHSQRSRGIPSNKLRALPPDPSTPLRSTHDDSGAKLFFHSRDLLVVFLRAMAVPGRADAQEKLEGVAEIVAVITVESVGAIIDCELCAHSNVEAVAV